MHCERISLLAHGFCREIIACKLASPLGQQFTVRTRFLVFFWHGQQNEPMDIVSLLRYVYDHGDKVMGVLLILLFATSALLLFRSISEKNKAGAGAGLNLDEIEGLLKRLLANQPMGVAEGAPISGDVAGAVAEREARIKELSDTLEKMKADMASKPANDPRVAEMQKLIDELQGRLAEYEIIEDDIADLSRYKDENTKLRAEVEALKAGKPAPASAAAPVAQAVAPVATPATESVAVAATSPLASATDADAFQLNTEDEVMREFAAAVESNDTLAPINVSTKITEPEPAKEPEAAAAAASLADDLSSGDAEASAADVANLLEESMPIETATDETDGLDLAPATLKSTEEMPFIDQSEMDALLSSVDEPAKVEEPAEGPLETSVEASTIETAKVDGHEADEDGDIPQIEVNTDKMLTEVEDLGLAGSKDSEDSSEDAMNETLDTDKLMAQMSDMNADSEAASVNEKQADQKATDEGKSKDVTTDNDDLLAEFRDAAKS